MGKAIIDKKNWRIGSIGNELLRNWLQIHDEIHINIILKFYNFANESRNDGFREHKTAFDLSRIYRNVYI